MQRSSGVFDRGDHEPKVKQALPATYRIECEPGEDAVTFQCEACGRRILDLRAVYLAHRPEAGWRIECSGHADAEHVMDAGHLFGGGLLALELFADLARARWFDAGELFELLTRLRAQARGVYRRPRTAQG
jgi:hypothetical protein